MILKKFRRKVRKNKVKILSIVAVVLLVILGYILYNSAMLKSGEKQAVVTYNGYAYRPLIIVTGSMEPTIKTNSLSIIKLCSFDDVGIGDVIMYKLTDAIHITHRVIEKHNEDGFEYLVTKGDANAEADNINILPEMVEGKIIKTWNWTGFILDKAMVSPGMLNPLIVFQSIVFVTVVIILIVLLYKFIKDTLGSIIAIIMQTRYYNETIEEYNELLEENNTKYNQLKSHYNIKPTTFLQRVIYGIRFYNVSKQVEELRKTYEDVEDDVDKLIKYNSKTNACYKNKKQIREEE